MSANIQDVVPDAGGNFTVDENVIKYLPEGSSVIEAVAWGASAWTRTAKITVRLPDDTIKNYFLKCAIERGAIMMEGEYQSLRTIYDLMPGFTPQVYGWGKFESSNVYFLLMDFIELKSALPNPAKFCARVVEMHQKSVSPTGQFGFHVPTCHGKNFQRNTWTPSWAACFTEIISWFFNEDVRVNGHWPEYEAAFEKLTTQTIPTLLGALQADGRSIKPCLVHGDLWDENTGVNIETGEPVVFDASALYAHNEMYNDMMFLINKYGNAQEYPGTASAQMDSIPKDIGASLSNLEIPPAASITS
ncbi:hypothetical protein SLS62_008637 [Diatrype stigma]|uniref:protein-ribulosamine 3-kinase n=1 Tax=Diatrype stigma TaxID=117547 RepID=A0AAN9UHE5_9PEZI